MDLDAFMNQWISQHGPTVLPGAMLMKYGPENYVGAAFAIRGTLYFQGAYTAAVREGICRCFDLYEEIARPHLRWLWRDEPPEGPDKIVYPKAKPMRAMIERMKENDAVSFAYIGGEKPEDASPWHFYVSGLRGWEAKMGVRGLDSLEFSLPMEYVEAHPSTFQKLFVEFARLLKAEHGHGGFALNISAVRREPNESTEAIMASKMNGMDAGRAAIIAGRHKQGITDHIKTIGWMTAINHEMLEKVGGMVVIRSELPPDWFALYDYGNGIVIQGGARPEKAGVEVDPLPAIYVLPNMILRNIRMPQIGSLHYSSKDGEPRLSGWAAEQWMSRFDVPVEELLSYKAKLLGEPKITKDTVLPDRL